MHMLTVSYKQFAINNLVHNADQIVNSYAENFIYSRSILTLEEGGYDEKVITDEQSCGYTRILDTLIKHLSLWVKFQFSCR